MISPLESSGHQVHNGDLDESSAALYWPFVFLGGPSEVAQPAECSLHGPLRRLDRKADLPDDSPRDQPDPSDPAMRQRVLKVRVASDDSRPLDRRVRSVHLRNAAVTRLDFGRHDAQRPEQSARVHRHKPLVASGSFFRPRHTRWGR